MSKPTLEYSEVESGENPTAAIILMHGIGDHGSSFVPLVPELDLSDCPNIRFVFPHAPVRSVTANGGYEMPAWYDIYGGFEAGDREDGEGIAQSKAYIEELIAEQIALGIPANKIVLAGFSQGCAMALETAVSYSEKLAGVMGLSGYIPMVETVQDRANDVNLSTPMFIAHGIADNVVNISRAKASEQKLTELGYSVEWHEYPMDHSLCMPELIDMGNWLRKVLA